MIEIRIFEGGDLDFALAQKLREGWAVSREQFEIYLEHDPDGCFVATTGGQPIGMVTTTCFGPSGWIGNLIVEPGHRSRGIGCALMEYGLERLRKKGSMTVRLEGDAPGIPLYRKLGFVDEYESCRFVLAGSSAIAPVADSEVETMSPGDLDEVAKLDAAIVGADRGRFLELKMHRAEVAFVRRRHGKIVASLLASPTDRGFRIGPCVAQSSADAEPLIAASVSVAADRPVLIGVPALNTDSLEILDKIGFEKRPSSSRMRFGPPVAEGDPTRLFAISSGAVG